ncbi:hypothetical protein FQN49_005027 [Arthroderma sp. PD_2]|nr:hypothetical protein FQN49_005027 [Arthroderma sp. PD_2]
MNERPVSPCQGPDEGHGLSSSNDRSSTGSPQPNEPARESQTSPVLNVFSDEFSVERLDDPANGQRQSLNSLSSQSSSSSDKTETETETERVGPVAPTSPFQGHPEPQERPSSQLLQRRQQLQQQQLQQQTVLPQMPDKIHFSSDVGPIPRTSSPAVSIAQSTTSAGHRSVSTISRFSIPPRALSPYTGQTGPSHPYAMYSQGISVNRTSSISSNSTARPAERNFVAAAPPQHPYALYSQNTVPEHVPDQPLNAPVPVTLPGHPQVYNQTTQPPVADEVGDILGTDGYREQLPPYSRYPDGIPEKSYYAPAENLGEVTAANTSPQSIETPASPVSQVSSSTLLTENAPRAVVPPPDSSSAESGTASQEKVNEKDGRRRNRKVCCGLPLWIIGLIAIGLITGTLIGGVLGGIVGARQGQKDDDPPTPDPDHTSKPPTSPTSTTSGTLDAIPLPTATDATTFSPIPTGDISISGRTFNSLSQSCVNSTSLKDTWGCIAYSHFKGHISGGPDDSRSIEFSQAPLTGKFTYGDQVPMLGNTKYKLEPVYDATSPEEGPAYFFYTTFDKLVIIPDDEFPHGVASRSVDESALFQRSANRSGQIQSLPGDKPWFCWWNTTHIETFIYANRNASEDDMMSNNGEDTGGEVYPSASATSAPRGSTPTSPAESSMSIPPSTAGDGDLPEAYARVVKIKELRFSEASSSPPYCQQMQVLDDWSLSMLKNQATIEEKNSEAGPSIDESDVTDNMARSIKLIGSRDVESDQCYCEWIYGN